MTSDTAGLAVVDPAIWVPMERVWPLFAGVPESLPTYTAAGVYVRKAPGVAVTAVASELRGRYEGPDSPLRRIPGSRLDAIDGLVRDFAVQSDA